MKMLLTNSLGTRMHYKYHTSTTAVSIVIIEDTVSLQANLL